MAELNFFDVLSNLASLFLLIAVGWAAVKGKILPAESSQAAIGDSGHILPLKQYLPGGGLIQGCQNIQ